MGKASKRERSTTLNHKRTRKLSCFDDSAQAADVTDPGEYVFSFNGRFLLFFGGELLLDNEADHALLQRAFALNRLLPYPRGLPPTTLFQTEETAMQTLEAYGFSETRVCEMDDVQAGWGDTIQRILLSKGSRAKINNATGSVAAGFRVHPLSFIHTLELTSQLSLQKKHEVFVFFRTRGNTVAFLSGLFAAQYTHCGSFEESLLACGTRPCIGAVVVIQGTATLVPSNLMYSAAATRVIASVVLQDPSLFACSHCGDTLFTALPGRARRNGCQAVFAQGVVQADARFIGPSCSCCTHTHCMAFATTPMGTCAFCGAQAHRAFCEKDLQQARESHERCLLR